jgi:hypothetical protein
MTVPLPKKIIPMLDTKILLLYSDICGMTCEQVLKLRLYIARFEINEQDLPIL